jgi:hypothetical protein
MGQILPANRTDHKHSDVDNPDPLYLAVRSQQNFAENVLPFSPTRPILITPLTWLM